jgi:hypothetical protein
MKQSRLSGRLSLWIFKDHAGAGRLIRFRQFIGGSLALASLNLTRRDILPTLTATLTTIAFDDSSLRWLEINT